MTLCKFFALGRTSEANRSHRLAGVTFVTVCIRVISIISCFELLMKVVKRCFYGNTAPSSTVWSETSVPEIDRNFPRALAPKKFQSIPRTEALAIDTHRVHPFRVLPIPRPPLETPKSRVFEFPL